MLFHRIEAGVPFNMKLRGKNCAVGFAYLTLNNMILAFSFKKTYKVKKTPRNEQFSMICIITWGRVDH